jgi:hypothetical protein
MTLGQLNSLSSPAYKGLGSGREPRVPLGREVGQDQEAARERTA